MIDATVLLADLQDEVRLLEADLRRQVNEVPERAQTLRHEYDEQRRHRRTAATWSEWRDAQLTQVAVAWVLSTVFLRWTEDNGLIGPTLTGPDERGQAAEEAQAEYFRAHRDDNDADWLAGRFDVLRVGEAGRLLFDRDHNPLYTVPISHDAARDLIAFWRRADGSGALRHNFADPEWDTRFLGDLYQDLSEAARTRYALLQTPRFVESFILDRTMTLALDEFGVRGFRLIDPACGSGHFLLDAFTRIVDAWREEATLEPFDLATTALASVHGMDVNPFAVAITRFRLSVAAWKVGGIRRLQDASGQAWLPVVGCGDSLRGLVRQGSFESVDEELGIPTVYEDIYRFFDKKLLHENSYHVAIGNPPYITPKDSEDANVYREMWTSCHRQFQLTVPFAELFFALARRPDGDARGAGYTGQITSNAFMKREFGTKLIEEFLPKVTLDYVIDTSGAYIPGHGTPTVILVGRRAPSRGSDVVRTVLGIRGEPEQPEDPEKGLVWTAILDQWEHPGSESEWISVVDLPRDRYAGHPWSLAGGGAPELMQSIERAAGQSLADSGAEFGTGAVTREDDVYLLGLKTLRRLRVPAAHRRELVVGDCNRDWGYRNTIESLWPYEPTNLNAQSDRKTTEVLWPFRTQLSRRVAFGKSQLDHKKKWFEYSMFFTERFKVAQTLSFAFVATHNHFTLDRVRRVFNRTSPILKLPAEASEDDHLALLGILNSSVACFWMKQVCHDKGSQGINEGFKSQAWERFFEFTGTKLEQFPLPDQLPLAAGTRLDALATKLDEVSSDARSQRAVPTRQQLIDHQNEHTRLRETMISAQEELDWEVYGLYGLLSDGEQSSVVIDDSTQAPGLNLGERAFEVVLAREVDAGRTDTQWFARHGSTPITELPAHWPDWYRQVVENRIAMIERRKDIALIERPECKRRWATEPWEKQQERALRTWLLDRCENRDLWYAPDANGDEQPTPHTVATLADALRADTDVVSVAQLWAQDALERTDVDLAEIVAALVDAEHVPFLPAYRYKPAGLAKRREWEHTWDLQRQEDQVAADLGYDDPTHAGVREQVRKAVGDVPVPPKYGSGDFVRTSYWRHRGKLDVPKEQFVSYPAASRDGDGSLLLGWAGWDHREQAQALAVLITTRRMEDGWDGARVTPLVAGLADLMPWVRQWHGEVDPAFGASPADVYQGFLDTQVQELGTTLAELAAWRPEGRVDVAPLPRRRAAAPRKERAPRTPKAVDPAHTDAVVTAAAHGPLSNEDIRALTGLDAAGARAVAASLVTDGRLATTGQRRGTRYVLPPEASP